MKIRTGFVSNSSGSSFLIGVSVVKNINKCMKYIKDNDIKNTTIKTFKDMKNESSWTYSISEDKIIVDSFDYSEVSVKTKGLKDTDFILTYVFFGNEGDNIFYENGEMDYDIDLDFFDDSEQRGMAMLSDPEDAGLIKDKTDWTYGAARNG